MEKDNSCVCYIGLLHDYDNTDVITLEELKAHIEMRTVYTMSDYCDRRKSTDLTRFNYCPMCGKKIDWKAMKGGE